MKNTATARKAAMPPGVQGIDVGMRMVFALAKGGKPLSLGELSRASNVPPSKTHRYLVSLCKAGMLEQDARSGDYDLGVKAISIGLAAQRRLNEYRFASIALNRLHERTGATASVVTWGDWGPVVALRKESSLAVSLNTRIGSVLPITMSSSGRLFAALLPEATAKPFIDEEFARGLRPRVGGKTVDRRGMEKLLAEIRRTHLSLVTEDLVAGVDALAAPIFDQKGFIIMAIAVVSPHGTLDLSVAGDACRTLMEEAQLATASLAKI